MTFDLFGNEIAAEEAFGPPGPKHKVSGYAATPGSGPEGSTCGNCQHAARIDYHNKRFIKCGVIAHRWTHGPGTDIRLKTPGCKFWEPTPAFAKLIADVKGLRGEVDWRPGETTPEDYHAV